MGVMDNARRLQGAFQTFLISQRAVQRMAGMLKDFDATEQTTLPLKVDAVTGAAPNSVISPNKASVLPLREYRTPIKPPAMSAGMQYAKNMIGLEKMKAKTVAPISSSITTPAVSSAPIVSSAPAVETPVEQAAPVPAPMSTSTVDQRPDFNADAFAFALGKAAAAVMGPYSTSWQAQLGTAVSEYASNKIYNRVVTAMLDGTPLNQIPEAKLLSPEKLKLANEEVRQADALALEKKKVALQEKQTNAEIELTKVRTGVLELSKATEEIKNKYLEDQIKLDLEKLRTEIKYTKAGIALTNSKSVTERMQQTTERLKQDIIKAGWEGKMSDAAASEKALSLMDGYLQGGFLTPETANTTYDELFKTLTGHAPKGKMFAAVDDGFGNTPSTSIEDEAKNFKKQATGKGE